MIKKLFFAVALLISINYSFAAIDVLAAGDPPILSNFRIENGNPNRVYFDSSEPITASTYTGFIISGKTITNVAVNSGQSTGHYFTVSSPFSFWDNNTIRYEGGSNLADADNNPLYAFTLEYIKNYIDEPAASSNTLYVATNGSDSNSGTSIDSPYLTIQKALSMARAGTTIYVRAGLYRVSNWVSMPSVGTSTSPLKIIGYKSTPGDINSNYYNYVYGSLAPDLDDSEMPVFERLSSSTGIFTAERGDDYIIFKNIQAREASSFVRSIYASNIIIENSNFKEAGDGGGDGSGLELIGSTTGDEYDISNYRIKNCVVINSGMANLDIKGNHNLIENVRTYCDNTRDAYSADGVSDYYINISGSNNIVRNSKAQRRNGVATSASGHGIGVKAGERSGFKHSYYNLFEKNYVIACNEGYYTRNTYADYNVFKDCEVDGLGVGVGTSYGVNGNGIVFYTDSKYNVAERMYIHDAKAAILYDNNDGEVPTNSDNTNNIIKNSIITNCYWAIRYGSSGGGNNPTLKDNKIYNNTFDNIVDFYYQDGTFSSISGNEFKNNILNSVGRTESLTGWTFDHNDFYNSTALGSNVLNENPQMDTNFMPSNDALKSGIPLASVVFDKDRVKRNATNPTIGALEIAAPTVGSVSPNTTICTGENATLVASGGTSYLWNSGETTDSITVSPAVATTYTVTVSDDLGNSDSHEVVVTVDQPPTVSLGDDLTICSGEEVTLTATGEGDFTWSTGETTPSITVSPTETTTYTVTASNSCAADATDELIITVNESPSLTTTGDVTICEGESVDLTATSNGSISWNTGETTPTITVSPTETTTYTVTSTLGACPVSEDIVVTVNQAPSVVASDDVTICSGEEVTLTATGTGNFTWNTGETTPSITVHPTETTTYTVTAGNSCASDVTDEVIVTVNETPTLTTSGDVTICEGQSIDLTATSNGNVTWNTGETTPTISVSPTETTTYTVTSTLGACPVSQDIVVTVNQTPSVTASDDLTICSGEEVILTATGKGNFTWSTGETTPSIRVSPSVTTTYTVTASSACAADVSDQVIVTVNETPSLTTSGNVTICEGENIDLVATSNGNVTWSTGETTPTITVSPSKTTTYTVTSTLGACPVSEDIIVTVIPTPSVIVTDDITICSGGEVTLTATGTGNFTWSTGETTARITVSPSVTTTYTVTASNACSAEATDQVTVTVNQSPTLTTSGDVTICAGESIDLTATSNGNVTWSTGETTPTITVSPTKTTSYVVTSTLGACPVSEEIIVTVNDAPRVFAGNDMAICPGEQVTLIASGKGNFTWSTGETTPRITVSPTVTTTYTVTASNSCGTADATDQVTVTVGDLPYVNAGSDVTINQGDSVTLNATGNGTFVWDSGQTGPTITVSPEVTTTYSVTVTTDVGCTSEDSVTVTVQTDSNDSTNINDGTVTGAGPDVEVCKNVTVVLTATGGLHYLWSTGETTQSISVTPDQTTTYSVTISTGTNITTDDVTVTIDENCSAISGRITEQDIKVYPNPATDVLNIELNGFTDRMILSVYNMNGSVIYSETIDNMTIEKPFKRQLNLSQFSRGLYFVRLSNNTNVNTKKVLFI